MTRGSPLESPEVCAALLGGIAAAVKTFPPERLPVRIMEVCGTHTMSIARHGIRAALPPEIKLVSGPGCPVCVTPSGYIAAAVELARRGAAVMTFGDLLYVPGPDGTLAEARAAGADVRVCHSPSSALDAASAEPEKEVVFLAVGFETTSAPQAALIRRAADAGVKNLSFLTAFKRIIPAMEALLSGAGPKIDGFICPAHVSAVIGSEAFAPVASKFNVPCAVAGFEPAEILEGILETLRRIQTSAAGAVNLYSRVVRPGGNKTALEIMEKVIEPCGASWRGIGFIPGSGHCVRGEFSLFDARKRFGFPEDYDRRDDSGPCRCGDVLRGLIEPRDCPLFGKVCVPDHPSGACMVSSEGPCAASYKHTL
jgi:hydrogenase expression/formation protein HypD